MALAACAHAPQPVREVDVRNILFHERSALRSCMQQYGVREGAPDTSLVIEADGSISSVVVIASEWSPEMNECFKKVVLAGKLPAPGERTAVRQRFEVGPPPAPPPPPTAAEIAEARARDTSTLARDAVAAVIERERLLLKRCVGMGPPRLTLRFAVHPDGHVLPPVVFEPRLGRTGAECVRGVVLGMRFPGRTYGKAVDVVYEVDLDGGDV